MTDQFKNILIGLFVAVAITIGVCLTLFLDPSVGDGKKVLHVRFSNIAGISVGTRVTFGGKVVGEVSSIKEVPNARELAADGSGTVFLYQLTLKIDSRVKLYMTDEFAIRTTGLMGERSVAILPRFAPSGTAPVSITDQILFANSVDPMENTINQIGNVASSVQAAVNQFEHWYTEHSEAISTAIDSFANLASEMNRTVAHINADGLSILRNLNQISADVASGNGTMGRFIKSEDFYLRLSSVMGKIETLMTDINHYGILFQYDKSWQRQRTKRINTAQALNTPAEFKTYFEGEISCIQTSLSRLTQVMSKANNGEEKQKIIQSESFKDDFGSLLRQVQGLTDILKLYNEELISPADATN